MQACTNDPFYNLGFGEHNKTVSDFGKKVKVCDGGGGPRLPPADEGKPVPRPTDRLHSHSLSDRATYTLTHPLLRPTCSWCKGEGGGGEGKHFQFHFGVMALFSDFNRGKL